MATLLELFLTFMKIGALSFGGGYAMIPFLQTEALRHNWLTLSEFTDIVAISQITPGPIAVNMATFVGYNQAAVTGALVATLGVCLPSFTLITVLVRFFVKFGETDIVKRIFFGLRPAVIGLIFAATFLIAKLEFFPEMRLNVTAVLIAAASFVAMYRFKLSPVICIAATAVAGIVIYQ